MEEKIITLAGPIVFALRGSTIPEIKIKYAVVDSVNRIVSLEVDKYAVKISYMNNFSEIEIVYFGTKVDELRVDSKYDHILSSILHSEVDKLHFKNIAYWNHRKEDLIGKL